jgi:UDP-4-amino-4,6-dideoxy-N-acetyl-beta-L-altrosamine N-acetyltransferase
MPINQRIRPMSSDDLALVLAWRNHPDIRSHMLSQREIAPDEHRRWFERSVETGLNDLLIFESEGGPMGFVSFRLPGEGGVSEWGFYTAPHAPKGTGRQLGAAALQHGFAALKLHKIVGRTLAGNERSIQFHRRFGFQQEGVLRQQHFDGERHHDIVCFGLLRTEWRP